VIATNVRRLSVYLVLAFASVSGALVWWQVLDAQTLATRQDNPQVIATRRSLPRGSIFDAQGRLLASSVVTDGISRRTYIDPAFTHLIGYASLRFGATGVERAWTTTGRAARTVARPAHTSRQRTADDADTDQRLQDSPPRSSGRTEQSAIVQTAPSLPWSPNRRTTRPDSGDRRPQLPFDAINAAPNNLFLTQPAGHNTPGRPVR
jgi:hypothetical protein